MNARLASDAGPGQLPRLLLCSLVLVLMSACLREASPATTPATVATTAPTTSTTVDRLAEVEAIVRELEERRLDALYRRDLEALRELYASEGLYELEVEVTGQELTFTKEPDGLRVDVLRLIKDTTDCLAAEVLLDVTEFVEVSEPSPFVVVLEPTDGGWGFSYVGTGWLCEGPNPIDADA